MTPCHKLHRLINQMYRFSFPFDPSAIPRNGIYILFESGECAHGGDRIVRVGTHTGQHQLPSRLCQHFLNENKDRSIFRKNIGRALLNREKDPFLAQWELDLTTREAKLRHSGRINFDKQQNIETQVSKYIRKNFTFVALRVESKASRLELESKIISTASMCRECSSSDEWLGRHSPKAKICISGLWLVNELYKNPLSQSDLNHLKAIAQVPLYPSTPTTV